jgi:hypothetical protein
MRLTDERQQPATLRGVEHRQVPPEHLKDVRGQKQRHDRDGAQPSIEVCVPQREAKHELMLVTQVTSPNPTPDRKALQARSVGSGGQAAVSSGLSWSRHDERHPGGKEVRVV